MNDRCVGDHRVLGRKTEHMGCLPGWRPGNGAATYLHSGCAEPEPEPAGLCLLCTQPLTYRSLRASSSPSISHAVCDLTGRFQSQSKALCLVSLWKNT